MDALMLGVTGVALALAVGMSVVAMRLLRGERHRSAARVAALESAAFDDLAFRDDAPDALDAAEALEAVDVDERDEFQAFEDVDDFREDVPMRRAARTEPATAHAAPAMRSRAARTPYRDIEIDAPIGPMFAATEEPKAPGRRWFALAAVGVVMAGLVGTIYTVFKPATVDAASTTSQAPAEGLSQAVPAAASQTRPIELLSLKHTVEGNTFTLVGLVVNPIDAAPLTRVVAVVYLFDKEGAYFASGKSTLEFPTLRPGEESPFSITIDHVGRIGKYRVGFRRDDGSVIAHLDKRGQRAGSMTEVGGE